MFYIYILECRNNTLYTGYTTDLTRRYQEHLDGSKKCKYTRSFPPKRIAASWELDAQLTTVLKLEAAIKKLTKKQKLALIEKPEKLAAVLKSI